VAFSLGHVPALAPSPNHPSQILPSVMPPVSPFLLPTRSTLNLSATLQSLPRKPLLRGVHQIKILHLAPARVEAVKPATRRNAFLSPLSGRLRRAAVRQILPSRPYLAIAIVSHQVKYETANVPHLPHPRQLPQRDLNPARLNPAPRRCAARRHAAQSHRSTFPSVLHLRNTRRRKSRKVKKRPR
jgi:hypothetical protein